MIYPNCTESHNSTDCQVIRQTLLPELSFSFTFIVITLTGSLLNALSLFIFIFSNNMDTKFLRLLKCYIVNSLVVTVNHFVLFTLLAFITSSPLTNRNIYYNGKMMSNSLQFTQYYSYIFLPVWTISYSYGSLLDITIVYERILMYLPKLKFMRNVQIYVYLLVFLLLSCVINLPANFSRDIYSLAMNLTNSPLNDTIVVYTIKKRIFHYNDLFTVCLYASTFMRDILTLVIEIAVTVILLITMYRFYNKKRETVARTSTEAISSINEQSSDAIIFRRTDMRNSQITLYICFISFVSHVGSFLALIVLYFNHSDLYTYIVGFFGFFFLIRHSVNFVLFLKLNKKFKRNFVILLPKCMKIKRQKKKKVVKTLALVEKPFGNESDIPLDTLNSSITCLSIRYYKSEDRIEGLPVGRSVGSTCV